MDPVSINGSGGPIHGMRVLQTLRTSVHRLSLLQRFAITTLTMFVVLGSGFAYLLGQSVQSATTRIAEHSASDMLRRRLIQHLTPQDLTRPMSSGRHSAFYRFLDRSILSDQTVRVKIWNNRGVVVHSSDSRIQGRRFPVQDGLATALHGGLSSEVANLSAAENRDDHGFGRLLEVYIPIRFRPNGPVLGAFEVYQRYDPIMAEIRGLQHTVYGLLAAVLCILYLSLFGVVRRGSKTIARQQVELVHYTEQLEDSYRQIIASLAAAVDARDSSTERHSNRVTEMAVALGTWINLPSDQLKDLERAALLHDVGKIGVSDDILLKAGGLTDQEWRSMRQHPEIGFHLLRNIAFLKPALPVVLHHHERWDGTGYPDRLVRDQIPLFARLFAVIDAYDAMTSDRPYRGGMTHAEAMARLRDEAGVQFDPEMVEAFCTMMEARHKAVAIPEQGEAKTGLFSSLGITGNASSVNHHRIYLRDHSGARRPAT